MEATDWISTRLAAAILAVRPAVIRRWALAGRIEGRRVGGRIQVRATEVRSLIRPVGVPIRRPGRRNSRVSAETRRRLAAFGLEVPD